MENKKYISFNELPKFTSLGSYSYDYSFDMLVEYIEKEVKDNGLILNPNFQRGHVWTEEQQIAYLEYFFRGGKSGTVVYLNNPAWGVGLRKHESDYHDYTCIDGLQRITAFSRFYHNEIKVFDSYFKEFIDKPRGHIKITLNVNDLQSEEEVLKWYWDMNAGGTPHSKEEIEKVKELWEKAKGK